MSLTEYRRKRQFDKTREPSPDTRKAPRRKAEKIAVERPIFVVQLHHASRRHYDFRLQVGDALKSWAVPKGPSYDPKVKRMAVEVEDHPLSYASFEGDIPQGEYGGGHVALFDQGVWTTPWDPEAQLAKGHLRFELFGDKLKGEWHLVRSGKAARQPQWLLFKEADAYAGDVEADDLLADVTPPGGKKAAKKTATKAATKTVKKAPVVAPKRRRKIDWAARAAKLTGAKKATLRNEAFAPQLAKLGDSAPHGPQWLHEVKWDGYRLVATMVGGKVRIWSRNAIEWTDKVPELRAALEQLGVQHLAVDGELIAGRGTQADFNLLQATLSGEQQGALSYVLFDLLHLDGIDVRNAPLHERKALLESLLATPVPHLAYSSHVPGTEGAAAFALASEEQFEGIISKRADRPYVSGRGDDWRKTKRQDSDEFAVVGTTPGQGARGGGFGSLLLARPDKDHGWSYAGRVGSGFSGEQIRTLMQHIGSKGSSKPTVHVPIALTAELKRATWFPPSFVVEVFIRGIGNSGVLRQPSLKTVRLDKDPDDLRDSDRSQKANKPSSPRKRGSSDKPAASTTKRTSTARERAPAPEVRLSSPTKIIFPDRNITKLQVFDYYRAVTPRLLPEIAGRPLSIIRCPNGAGSACFFQKHHTAGLDIVRFVRLKEEGGHNANYLVVDDEAGLMELVQFNALEFHPWGAHADDPDRADRVVFDLDPGPDVPFAEVKRSAKHVRDLLEQLGLKSFLRTTGGKGLHVVVPLNPANNWSLVKKFAKGFAEALAGSDPDRYLATATLKLRPGKIFVDYLRNGRGATAVASYSLRARPGAPVAVPLAWSELAALKRGDAFDLEATVARLKKQRKDPWAGIGTVKQDLGAWA